MSGHYVEILNASRWFIKLREIYFQSNNDYDVFESTKNICVDDGVLKKKVLGFPISLE